MYNNKKKGIIIWNLINFISTRDIFFYKNYVYQFFTFKHSISSLKLYIEINQIRNYFKKEIIFFNIFDFFKLEPNPN